MQQIMQFAPNKRCAKIRSASVNCRIMACHIKISNIVQKNILKSPTEMFRRAQSE